MTKLDKEIQEGLYDPKKKQSEYKKFESARLSAYTKSFGSRAKAKSAIKKAYLAYKRKERDTAMRLNDLPSRWYEAMVRGIKKSSDVRNPYAIVKSLWSKLSPSKKADIRRREMKGERFKYDLPLPVDKPTRGTGTVRTVKPFNLGEVQVSVSVKDYLALLKSGLFNKMKRQTGEIALVKRCKSDTGNVNLFIDKG